MARQTSRKQPGARMSELTPPRIVPFEPQPLHLSLHAPSSGWSLPAPDAQDDAPRRSVMNIDGELVSERETAAAKELPRGACVIVLDLD